MKRVKVKKNLKYKLLLLFLAVNAIFIASISYYTYIDAQHKEQEILIDEAKRKIEIDLLKVTLLLVNYHENIFNGEYIDPQSYLDIVRKLSLYTKSRTSSLISIESYTKEKEHFILTASSANKDQFKSKTYPQYGDRTTLDAKFLSQVAQSKKFEALHQDNLVAMNFVDRNNQYIVVAKVNKPAPPDKQDFFYVTLLIVLGLVLSIIILLRFIIVPFVRQIWEIDDVLNRLFSYILHQKDANDITYIQNTGGGDFGTLAETVNE
ncbi:MAG: hypothetical protein JXQ76_01080, partial [Campylobacterales bacterium]|nr:hypothetical protein [Campylobacterales bacterium]